MVGIPDPSKCCCCVPLRPGLLAWSYIRLIMAAVYLVLPFYLSWVYLEPNLSVRGDLAIEWAVYICLFLVNLVFSVIFIIGVHHENYKLLLVFFVVSMLEVVATAVALGYQMLRKIYHWTVLDYWSNRLGFITMTVIPLVVNIILLPIYFMVVIRSELYNIKAQINKPARKSRV